MSSFVSAFSPIYTLSSVTYPVVETKISGREVENDGSIKPSRELTVESTTYDQRGQVVMNQNYTVEIWV
jgi:hypothetical protein